MQLETREEADIPRDEGEAYAAKLRQAGVAVTAVRHDYHLDVAGGFPVAHYVYDIVEADGLRFPTKRRAYLRGPHLKPIRDLLLVSLDLSKFRLTT